MHTIKCKVNVTLIYNPQIKYEIFLKLKKKTRNGNYYRELFKILISNNTFMYDTTNKCIKC